MNRDFSTKLNSVAREGASCEWCGARKFSITPEPITIESHASLGVMSMLGPSLECMIVTCDRCGLVKLFATGIADPVPPPEPNTRSATPPQPDPSEPCAGAPKQKQ